MDIFVTCPYIFTFSCHNYINQMVVVWDISHAVRGGEVSIIAKAHTDVDICRMKIAQFDDTRCYNILCVIVTMNHL